MHPSISSNKLSTLCFDLYFSDSEIFFINAFTSAHMRVVVSFGVGVVDSETTARRIHRTDRNHDTYSRLQAFLLRGYVSTP